MDFKIQDPPDQWPAHLKKQWLDATLDAEREAFDARWEYDHRMEKINKDLRLATGRLGQEYVKWQAKGGERGIEAES